MQGKTTEHRLQELEKKVKAQGDALGILQDVLREMNREAKRLSRDLPGTRGARY